MPDLVRPTEVEVFRWILDTAVHAGHIEYYLQELQIGSGDPDRPHDIVHLGNKFEWESVRGYALQFRENGLCVFRSEIMASRQHHRQQYHHRMWNHCSPEATDDAMHLGAVDAVCSLLEPRVYTGGPFTFDNIGAMPPNLTGQGEWMKRAVEEMRSVTKPKIFGIRRLSDIPSEGIDRDTYSIITDRMNEAFINLERDQGYKFGRLLVDGY